METITDKGSQKDRKRKKNKNGHSEFETNSVNCFEDNETAPASDKIRKKHKKKKHDAEDLEDIVPVLHKKRKKSRRKLDEDSDLHEQQEIEEDVHIKDQEEQSLKRKKKKRTTVDSESANDVPLHNLTEQNGNEKKQKRKISETPVNEHTEIELPSKKKKNKKKRKSKEDVEYLDLDDNQIDTHDNAAHVGALNKDKSEKKKSKRRSKEKCENQVNLDGAVLETAGEPHTKKHKKKKKSKKEDKEEPDDSKSSEADNELVKVNSNANSVQTQGCGQWQGDLFESQERQNKFMRLLGGLKNSDGDQKKKGLFSSKGQDSETKKKGLFGSLQPSDGAKKKGLFGSLGSKTVTGNTSMSASAAANLNQRLEEEYNRAMNFKLSGKKTSGFGFTQDPAEGKKFHIDVSKSKSIKFDDD